MVIEFARAQIYLAWWHHAWNSRDVELILSLYTEEVVVESPLAVRLVPGSNGRVEGKSAVREYWRKGLEASPDHEFQIMDLFAGVDCITIVYRPKPDSNRRVAEILYFDENDKIVKVIVTHAG